MQRKWNMCQRKPKNRKFWEIHKGGEVFFKNNPCKYEQTKKYEKKNESQLYISLSNYYMKIINYFTKKMDYKELSKMNEKRKIFIAIVRT